jgi:integrase
VTIPLSARGVHAFRRFVALGCWGPFSRSSMRQSFKRACAALEIPVTLTPYQLRHSFGTLVYASSGDLHATGLLLGHRDARTTARYALGAVDPRLAATVQGMRFGTGQAGVRRGGSSPPSGVPLRPDTTAHKKPRLKKSQEL